MANKKGSRAHRIDDLLLKIGIKPVIPSKENEGRTARVEFDLAAYRKRSIVECLIGSLKECRRMLTRFEKSTKNFDGMVKSFLFKDAFVLLRGSTSPTKPRKIRKCSPGDCSLRARTMVVLRDATGNRRSL